MNTTQLLEKVMERLKKQFLASATFTLKEYSSEENLTEVNVYVHGLGTVFASSMEYLLEQAGDAKEDIRKINKIADFLILFFIKSIQIEKEAMVILEVVENLEYLYEINVKEVHHVSAENDTCDSSRLAALVLENGKDKHIVFMDADQMKREYEGRFESLNAPDILVDLKEIATKIETVSYEEALSYTEKLNRNITLLNQEESQLLLGKWRKHLFLSSIS